METGNRIDVFLQAVKEQKGSDLHLSAGIAPRVRIDGVLIPLETEPLWNSDIEALMNPIMKTDIQERFKATKNVDFAHDAGAELGRFRVNAYETDNGLAAVFRLIPAAIPSADDLGIPQSIRDFTQLPNGLVLITGITGSGKSTTMAALVDIINETRHGHIITIEDPVEFKHQSKGCIVSHREMGHSALSFPTALRAALREDPDVIVIGEMRDAETIQHAITAAETGHLVLGTLHTYSAAKAVDRIVDAMPPDSRQQLRDQLAELLRGVVAQTLVPKAKSKGRIAAFEIMITNDAVRNALKKGGSLASIYDAMHAGRDKGMVTMEQALAQLVVGGAITLETARLHANDKDKFDSFYQTVAPRSNGLPFGNPRAY